MDDSSDIPPEITRLIEKTAKRELKHFKERRLKAKKKGKQPPLGIETQFGSLVYLPEDHDRAQEYIRRKQMSAAAQKNKELQEREQRNEVYRLANIISDLERVKRSAMHVGHLTKTDTAPSRNSQPPSVSNMQFPKPAKASISPLRLKTSPFGIFVSVQPDELKVPRKYINSAYIAAELRDTYTYGEEFGEMTEQRLYDGTLNALSALCSHIYTGCFIIIFVASKTHYNYLMRIAAEMLGNLSDAHSQTRQRRGSSQTFEFKYVETQNGRTLFQIYRNHDLRIFEVFQIGHRITDRDIDLCLKKHSIFAAKDIIQSGSHRAIELRPYVKNHADEFMLGGPSNPDCTCMICLSKRY